ncbi:PLP-dependent aminotransferase family protein [Actinomadura barringtoniae]|uniref:PLP-dependent aminotransferase family protein n=1 Tax=Actinomadura barringtoniae TaxID=1427535 RepID=A0A939PJT8_9ACTN|nr:PLP-dependent aminotransferase family protein [Actinomadura barringtoniae]MBO2454046.1 PLP-dependent aminotransferase family protein [Actinomadura barringtoniae]
MEDYRLVADAVAADIAAGRLRPGERLATQRAFARERGIAGSTAGRVYKELARRGLVVGEVGRGTFVRAAGIRDEPALAEPAGARVDLELNYPVVPGQSALLTRSLERLAGPGALDAALRPVGVTGTPAAREATAALLARPGWSPDPSGLLFAGNGRQAIAAAMSALVPAGERLGVEALTYPVVKGLANRLGITLVPLATDEHGLRPDALARAGVRAVYLQPTLQNPFSTTMPEERRAELAKVLRRADVHAIEDAIWAFLLDDGPAPLAAFAPERTILVDSLSKRLAPGLTLGFAVTPPALAAPMTAALRSGAWMPTGYAMEAATGWMTGGTVATITGAKRADVVARQRILRDRLDGFRLRTAPRSYFCWWDLPPRWRAETFVAAAARRGIAVTPAAAFVVGNAGAPSAVRFGLASPPPDVLDQALGTLAQIAKGTPDDTPID